MGKDKLDGDSLDSLDAAIAKQFASDNVSTHAVILNYKMNMCKIQFWIKDQFLGGEGPDEPNLHQPYK